MDQFGPGQNRSTSVSQSAKTSRSTATSSARANTPRGAAREAKQETNARNGKAEKAASLGNLNAAHASQVGLSRASINSTVGQIAAYKEALLEKDFERAAVTLAGVANKGITPETVKELNALVGVTLTDAQIASIAQQARDQQRSVAATTRTPAMSKDVSDKSAALATTRATDLGRLNAAHASTRALSRASAHSAVGRVNAYQEALAAKDYETAAAMLAAASNKAITPETVRGLNGLLGVTLEEETLAEVVSLAKDLQQTTTIRR
jgi:hypothetical protein